MNPKICSQRANGIRMVLLLSVLFLAGCDTSLKATPALTPIAPTIPGVTLYYLFNGDANDMSGNQNNGQVHGATLTTDRFGASNHAYYFDGVDDDIVFDASKVPLGPSPRTISVWIKAESFPPAPVGAEVIGSRATVIGWGNDDWNQLCEMQIVDSKLQFHIYGLKDPSSSAVLELKKWYHLAIVYTEGTVSLYVNGIEEKQEASSIDTSIGVGKGRIGAYPDPNKTGTMFPHGYDLSYFHGTIDDISVYNQALTAGQITELYREGGWGE